MQLGFWKKLKRPIMTMAPMSGITDEAFRRMLLKCGRPDVFWTEFASIDGLFSKGRKKILSDLKFIKAEHPIVAQVFGTDPDLFEKTAVIVRKLGFDGIDINMGCPNRDVEKMGAGAALIKNPDLAKQIIKAVEKGAEKLPVSVKTRIGYSKDEIDKWIPILLKENIATLTIHLRTRGELFSGPVHWELAKKIIKLRNRYSPETLIFGNGGVESLERARFLAKKTGLDGIMIGKGVLNNPWFFSEREPDIRERLNAILEHNKIFEKLNKNNLNKEGEIKNFNSTKKYLKAYAAGFNGAKGLRDRLMNAKNAAEVRKIIEYFLKKVLI
jgi:nifR3 family TIM-barrel protein